MRKLVLILALVACICLVMPASAWYSTYGYRQLHNVTGTTDWTANQTNYQVLFYVNNSSSTSSGSIAYTNGTTAVDWSDIRFTSTSDSLYDYWIESTNATTAKVWVEIPSVYNSTTATQMYLYYNKSGQTPVSNGTATFVLFDGFDNGTTLDTSKWTAAVTSGTASATVANGNLTLSGFAAGVNGATVWLYPSSSYSAPYQLIARALYTVDFSTSNNAHIPFGTHNHMSSNALVGTSNGYRMTISDSAMLGANIQEWSGSWTTTQTAYALSKQTWYHHTVSLLASGANNVKLQEYNESGSLLVTAQVGDTTRTSGYIALVNNGDIRNTRNDGVYDWVFIKNYAATEPAHSTWYAAETYTAPGDPPTSSFTYDHTSGYNPLTVTFTDTSNAAGTSWNWTFQDVAGNNTKISFSTDQNPSNVFNTGNFSIKLNSTNAYGSQESLQTSWVNVTTYSEPALSGYASTINLTKVGTTVGSQTGYTLPLFVTTGTLSPNLNTLNNGMVVEDNFTQWLQYSLPVKRYPAGQQPVIWTESGSSWSNNQVNDQTFLIDGDTLRCYYEGVYTPDGSNLNHQGAGVASISLSKFLQDGPNAVWDENSELLFEKTATIRMGTAIKVTNVSSSSGVTYYLYTAETGGAHTQDIQVYTGETYNVLTKKASDIISPAAGEDYAQNPAVIREDATTWKMYYDVSKGGGSSWAVDVATSTDGITWTRQAQVFTTGQTWDNQKIEHIHAMKVGDTYVVTYEAADDGSYSHWGVGMAYSTDYKGTFTKFAGNPILEGDREDKTVGYGHVATPAWLKVNQKWYLSVCENQHTTGWGNDWGISLLPVNMPSIQVTGTNNDFSDIRFSLDGSTALPQYVVDYETSNWAKLFVKVNTTTPTYAATNVAASGAGASVTASSTYTGSDANNTIDGSYSTEWRSNGEGTGAYLNITLASSKNLGKINIFGSSDSGSGIYAGHITFSDGSVVRYGTVPNPGSSSQYRTVEFPARTTTWFIVTVDSPMVLTTSRLMEVEAYEWSSGVYNETVRMHYGNAAALDANDASIFMLWDSFSSWNATRWGAQPAWATLSGGVLTLATTALSSNQYVKSDGTFPTASMLDAKFKVESPNNKAWIAFGSGSNSGAADNRNQLSWSTGSGNKISYYTNDATSPNTAYFWVGETRFGAWNNANIARVSNDLTYFWNLPAGSQNVGKAETSSANVPDGSLDVSMGVNSSGAVASNLDIDYILVRPFVYPEPYFSYNTSFSSSGLTSAFTATPVSGSVPLSVQFNDTSSGGTPTAWLWSFGDHTQSTTQNPLHIYNEAGVYSVTLTASNVNGSSTLVKTNYITVSQVSSTYPGWTYNATLDITNPATRTNFQHFVNLSKFDGMNNDFSDIRFTEISGTNCPYWVESQVNGSYTHLWIKIPSSGQTQIKMYWGNASATSASDGDTTFDYFDHFDSPTLNTGKWGFVTNGSGSYSIANSELTMATGSTSLTYASLYGTADIIQDNEIVEAKVREVSGAPTSQFEVRIQGDRYGYGLFTALQNWGSGRTIAPLNGWVLWGTPFSSYITNTSYILSAAYNGTVFLSWKDRAAGNVWTRPTYDKHLGLGIWNGGATGETVATDWIIERKYVTTMPVFVLNNTPAGNLVASFTGATTNYHYPLSVQFTDTSTGGPTSWNWSFNNVTPGNNTPMIFNTTQNPLHDFYVGNYNITLAATNINGTSTTSTPFWVNVSSPKTLNMTFRDTVNNTVIPVVNVLDVWGNGATTTAGTASFSYVTNITTIIYSTASGYYSNTTAINITADTDETIYMTPTGSSSTVTYYSPWQVRIRVVDSYGVPLEGVAVSAAYIATTLPSTSPSWLVSAYGVNENVANDMVNGAVAMSGVTDSNGGLSFTMFKSIQYSLAITNTSSGISAAKTLYPTDQEYVIKVATASQVAGTNTLTALQNTSLPVYQLNSTAYNLSAVYHDTTGRTSDVWFYVKWRNGTIIHQYDMGNPGTSAVSYNYTIINPGIGTEVIWMYNATRSGL